jgi:hypothetical protein
MFLRGIRGHIGILLQAKHFWTFILGHFPEPGIYGRIFVFLLNIPRMKTKRNGSLNTWNDVRRTTQLLRYSTAKKKLPV